MKLPVSARRRADAGQLVIEPIQFRRSFGERLLAQKIKLGALGAGVLRLQRGQLSKATANAVDLDSKIGCNAGVGRRKAALLLNVRNDLLGKGARRDLRAAENLAAELFLQFFPPRRGAKRTAETGVQRIKLRPTSSNHADSSAQKASLVSPVLCASQSTAIVIKRRRGASAQEGKR